MKRQALLYFQIAVCSMLSSCSSDDDNTAVPVDSSDNGFFVSISQQWEDTAGTKTYFFGDADSLGRFTGNENDGGNQNSLIGNTKSFDFSFTVIKDQFTNYVDYKGKFTDTLSTHKRIVVYSKIDTLYLKPN